jgi:hypothetical protein
MINSWLIGVYLLSFIDIFNAFNFKYANLSSIIYQQIVYGVLTYLCDVSG